MLNIIIEGIQTLGVYRLDVLILLLSGLSLGSISALILFRHDNKFDGRIVFVLLLGFVFMGVLAPILGLLNALNAIVIAPILVLGVVATISFVKRGAFADWKKEEYRKNVWIPLLIFFVSLILRLAYLQELVLPPFSDSAKHFEKLSSLLSLEYAQPLSFADFSPYYHWGFYGITAWVDVLTGNFTPLTMAITAHFFLGLFPVTIYFMLLSFVNGDVSTAVFGALLAGFGWIMPSFAISYGKYPALVAICLLPLLFGLFHLYAKSNHPKHWEWWLYIAIVSVAIIWIHSRLAIFLTFFYLTYYISHYIRSKLSANTFEASAFLLVLVIIFWVMVLNHNSDAKLSFLYYLGLFKTATILIVVLLPFAFMRYTVFVYQWAIIIILSIFAATMPLPSWVYHYPLTLFDQTFFDLIFFIPLTIFGVLGVNGILRLLSTKERYRAIFLLIIILIVGINGIFIQPWQPLNSSNYVSQDDIRAFSWIRDNSQPNSIFIIASIKKNINYSRASDAGVWINPLTGNATLKIPYQYQWNSSESLRNLCAKMEEQHPIYVYVGHVESSFYIPSCNIQQKLSPILCYPQTKILL